MKRAVIWDLDGTLLDSYHVIVESLRLSLLDFGVDLSYEQIWQYAITYSSSALIQKVAKEVETSPEEISRRYSQISGEKYRDIRLMEHAMEILDALEGRGVENFVYTHRGKTTIPVLKNLGIEHFFKEVLTSKSGFSRKPHPGAIQYLMEKYDLSCNSTYYAGDRNLDMECAKNAGIPGILYLPEGSRGEATGVETFIVKDLLDILPIV